MIPTKHAWVLIALALVSAPIRSAEEEPDKCQVPAGTQPFEFSAEQNHLRGFIDIPATPGRHPVVLVIHGSGSTDVFNGNSEYNGKYESFRKTFRDAGFATAVWDKAGNGCSTGGYPHGNPIRVEARETLAALRALKQRADIDAAKMGLWGISQGAWVGPMAAVQTDDVDFLILVSAPASDAVSQLEYKALMELRARGTPEAELKVAAAHLRRAFAIMRAGGAVEEYVAAVEPLQKYPSLRELGITVGTPENYRKWQDTADFHYRSDTALRELHQPVLALFGDQDVLVNWSESARIFRDVFKESGNRDLTIRVFKNADHNQMTGSPPHFVDGYFDTMRAWLTRVAAR
ncbi:MAG TPA: alpha/beta hydrolase [Steroidobacteraceae bacterium]|nr:alpha/beta hydrolase [Steroidobacteraceae bacterium]